MIFPQSHPKNIRKTVKARARAFPATKVIIIKMILRKMIITEMAFAK